VIRVSLVAAVLALGLGAAPASAASTRLAVLYFENQGNPELEMLKLGLAQMLITDLAPEPGLEVVERTRLNDILGELDLQKTATVDPQSAVRIGKILGVQYLVQGYYLYFKPVDSLIIGAQLVSVETGAVVSGFRTQGKQSEFLGLEAKLVAGLLPGIRKAAGIETPKGVEPAPEEGSSKKKKRPTKVRSGGGAGPASRAESTTDSVADQDDEGAADGEAMAALGPVDSLGAALAFSEGLDALDRRDIPPRPRGPAPRGRAGSHPR
jgi:TolB-like protein